MVKIDGKKIRVVLFTDVVEKDERVLSVEC